MSLASDLLDQASTLASLDPMEPKQASLGVPYRRHII
jgi:hypothetical protein